MRDLLWVDTARDLADVVERIRDCALVAFDAEMDSYYSYRTKLCLVQVSAGNWDALIDPLALTDLSALNEVTEDPEIVKVFHAGENDVPYFRGHQVRFNNIFDTHIAAKVLELPTKSLGGLVERYFEVVLPKDQSRADWRIRPLPEEQVEYARQDTLYLCELAEILQRELDEAEAVEEAEGHFKALEPRELREKSFEPDGWVRIKGVNELSAVQRSVMAELYRWREEEAERQDLAVFRVVQNGALLSLSRKRFSEPGQLKTWAKSDVLRDNAEVLVGLIQAGLNRGGIPLPDLRKKKPVDWSAADEKLFAKLREWRNTESERRGVEPSRIMANKQLKKIARERPSSPAGLASLDGVESWMVEKYGDDLLKVLAAHGK